MRDNEYKLSFKNALFKGAFIHNPVLTQIIGICPIVACCKKTTDALAMSVMLAVILLVNEVITSLFLKKVQRWVRVAIYPVLSCVFIALVSPNILKIASDNAAGIGIYLYLLCTNALVVIRCEKFSCKVDAFSAAKDAVSFSIGYGIIAVVVGAIREMLVFGDADMGSAPFVALMILGFLAAIHKKIVKSFFPGEITDTFSMSKIHEKIVLKDPGLFKANQAEKKQLRSRYEDEGGDF